MVKCEKCLGTISVCILRYWPSSGVPIHITPLSKILGHPKIFYRSSCHHQVDYIKKTFFKNTVHEQPPAVLMNGNKTWAPFSHLCSPWAINMTAFSTFLSDNKMVNRISLFISKVPDWNLKVFLPIVATQLNHEINTGTFRVSFSPFERTCNIFLVNTGKGRKKIKLDLEQVKNSDEFLGKLVGIYGEIMAGRLTLPTSEEILNFCENKFNVSGAY